MLLHLFGRVCVCLAIGTRDFLFTHASMFFDNVTVEQFLAEVALYFFELAPIIQNYFFARRRRRVYMVLQLS